MSSYACSTYVDRVRLILSAPVRWKTVELPNQTVFTFPDQGETEGLLAFSRLMPLPPDMKAWANTTLSVELGASRLGERVATSAKNKTGYAIDLIECDVLSASDQVVEVRLAAFYRFLEWSATVLVRWRTREGLEAHRAEIREVLQNGHPDWRASGRVMCVHELMQGIVVDGSSDSSS